MSVLDNVRIGGVVATGSHGAKFEARTIVDQVVGLQIVTGDGELHEFSDEKNRNEMEAARVSLGKPMFRVVRLHLICRRKLNRNYTFYIIYRRFIRYHV